MTFDDIFNWMGRNAGKVMLAYALGSLAMFGSIAYVAFRVLKHFGIF